MKELPNKKILPHSISALLQPKSVEEPTLSTFHLFGEPLVCLALNGEERLCLAQISSRLLRDFSYNEIHNRRVALGITCVQCSPRQLELLRRVGAMPLSSRRCGTITKREAQRLVESFLQHLPAPPRLPENFAFEVVHCCGWGCTGYFVPTRYNSSRAKCVQCAFCHAFFSPNKFIFHCHSAAETGIRQHMASYRHPDAANFNAWRRHLLLADPNPPDSLLFAWEDIKAMFNGGNRTKKANLSLPPPPPATDKEIHNPNFSLLAKRSAPLETNSPLNSQAILASVATSQCASEMVGGTWSSGGTIGTVPGQSISKGRGDCSSGGFDDSFSAWSTHLQEYLEKVTQGIYIPPPPPPSHSNFN